MRTLVFSDAQNQYRERLRAFLADDVVPHMDRWETEGLVPRSVWRQMGASGFLCPCLASAYGGRGGDFRYAVIMIEELARIGQNGLGVPLHSDIVVPYIDSYGSDAIKARFLPGCASGETITAVAMTEPGAGSDLAAMQATAEEHHGEVVINGVKTFISNGINCDVVVVAARDPGVDNPYEAISLYVVESTAPGFSRGRQLRKMGLKSQDTAELFFNQCRIPVSQRLGEKGQGFLMLMDKLQQERLVVAAWAVAIAERVVDHATAHCKTHGTDGVPLKKSQAAQFALVEMATQAKLGRTFVDALIQDHTDGKQVVVETSMAKYWTTDMVQQVTERAVDLMGMSAIRNNDLITRLWRDMRVMRIFAGTNEIMKNIVARFMGL